MPASEKLSRGSIRIEAELRAMVSSSVERVVQIAEFRDVSPSNVSESVLAC
jgi:hypothetical protein